MGSGDAIPCTSRASALRDSRDGVLDDGLDLAAFDLVAERATDLPELPGVRGHGGLHEAEVDLHFAEITFDLVEIAFDLGEITLDLGEITVDSLEPVGHLLAEPADLLAQAPDLLAQA